MLHGTAAQGSHLNRTPKFKHNTSLFSKWRWGAVCHYPFHLIGFVLTTCHSFWSTTLWTVDKGELSLLLVPKVVGTCCGTALNHHWYTHTHWAREKRKYQRPLYQSNAQLRTLSRAKSIMELNDMNTDCLWLVNYFPALVLTAFFFCRSQVLCQFIQGSQQCRRAFHFEQVQDLNISPPPSPPTPPFLVLSRPISSIEKICDIHLSKELQLPFLQHMLKQPFV